MPELRNSPRRYGWVARVMHWSSVALMLAIYIGISGIDVPPKVQTRDAVVASHVGLGLALAGLMLARFVWRLSNPNPARAYRLPHWQLALAMTVHRCLYGLVFTACAAGVAALATADDAPPGFEDVQQWLGADPILHLTAAALHDALAGALLVLIVVHASAAIVNQIFGTD